MKEYVEEGGSESPLSLFEVQQFLTIFFFKGRILL